MKLTTFKPATGRVLARPRSLVALVILGGLAAQAQGFQQYQIWGLPEGPGDASRATALQLELDKSDPKLIVGQVRVDNRWLPALWPDGAKADPIMLKHLGFGGDVNALSGGNGDDVWIAAGMVLDEQGRQLPALWWDSRTRLVLLPFPFADGSVRSMIFNDGNLYLVGTAITQSGLSKALVWEVEENNITLIELLGDPRFRESGGNDIGIAPDGELVVVGYAYELKNAQAVEWRRTGGEWQRHEKLPPLGNGLGAAAFVQSVNGEVLRVAGEAETGAGSMHPVLWSPQQGGGWSIKDLGLLPGLDSGRVNSLLLPAVQQLLAVGEGSDETGSKVAMGWTVEEGEKVVADDLNSLIVNRTKLRLRSANSVQQAQETATTLIVGDATSPDGESHAYLLVEVLCEPCDTNCDGSVDLTDVRPFKELILGRAEPCDTCAGDTNGDGTVDLTDVEGFIECLLG